MLHDHEVCCHFMSLSSESQFKVSIAPLVLEDKITEPAQASCSSIREMIKPTDLLERRGSSVVQGR